MEAETQTEEYEQVENQIQTEELVDNTDDVHSDHQSEDDEDERQTI